MLSISEINCLGDITDTTWGKYSTKNSPTRSVKTSLSGDMFTVTYTMIVTFGSESAMSHQLPRYQEESADVTNSYIKDLKKEFKERSGRALKVKEVSTSDSVEVIYTAPHMPRKTAYYRRVTTYTVS